MGNSEGKAPQKRESNSPYRSSMAPRSRTTSVSSSTVRCATEPIESADASHFVSGTAESARHGPHGREFCGSMREAVAFMGDAWRRDPKKLRLRCSLLSMLSQCCADTGDRSNAADGSLAPACVGVGDGVGSGGGIVAGRDVNSQCFL
eukprot:SAG31_NODE_280_length_18592_cov_33.584113_9_plen_148_part_00